MDGSLGGIKSRNISDSILKVMSLYTTFMYVLEGQEQLNPVSLLRSMCKMSLGGHYKSYIKNKSSQSLICVRCYPIGN